MDLLNIGCTRLGCGATDKLQVDHRVEWSTINVTELVNLDWLCPHDHRLKTYDGWQLEPGTGKRTMHPPGQQWWQDHRRRPTRRPTAPPRGLTKPARAGPVARQHPCGRSCVDRFSAPTNPVRNVRQ